MAETFGKWDMADYLTSPEDIAEYLNQVVEDGDQAELSYALGVVARAKGMTTIARETGMSREGLYTSLGRNGNPTFSTLWKVLGACGVRLRFEAL